MGLRRSFRKMRKYWKSRGIAKKNEKILNSFLLRRDRGESINLHIGCGTNYFPGWINIDNNSDTNITELDLNLDLRVPLPFVENSIDFIFNEHFLEHLAVEEGINAIRDFLRVLKPGGVLRIAMPDLAEVVGQYHDPQWKEIPEIKRFAMDFVQTRAELININFRWWGHKWLYDWEELERRIRDAGGRSIEKCAHSMSRHSALCNLETRRASTLIAEVTKLDK